MHAIRNTYYLRYRGPAPLFAPNAPATPAEVPPEVPAAPEAPPTPPEPPEPLAVAKASSRQRSRSASTSALAAVRLESHSARASTQPFNAATASLDSMALPAVAEAAAPELLRCRA